MNLTIEHISKKLIRAICFAFAFSLFSFDLGGGESRVGLAELLSLVLLGLNFTGLLYYFLFRPLAKAEKMVMLCLAVAVASLLASQISYAWPGHLLKGAKQISGLAFVIALFFIFRFHTRTPEAFAGAVKWLWRGNLVLALLGIWQSVAFNILHTSFLADWSWVSPIFLTPFSTFEGVWRAGGNLGPFVRVNAIAPEPAHYCRSLLMTMGLVFFRLAPSRQAEGWQSGLPSWGAATLYLLAYFLSFSLLGLFGLLVMLVSYILLFEEISWKKVLCYSTMIAALIFSINYVTEASLIDKIITIDQFMPADEREVTTEAISSLVLAANLEVAAAGVLKHPLLGWGIGGHPFAFENYTPLWIDPEAQLATVNTQDAAALGIRLLSEMGLLGLLAFLGTFAVILAGAWRALKLRGRAAPNAEQVLGGAVLLGAVAEVVIYLARMPYYFNLSFWMLLALVSVIPQVLAPASAGENLVDGRVPRTG